MIIALSRKPRRAHFLVSRPNGQTEGFSGLSGSTNQFLAVSSWFAMVMKLQDLLDNWQKSTQSEAESVSGLVGRRIFVLYHISAVDAFCCRVFRTLDLFLNSSNFSDSWRSLSSWIDLRRVKSVFRTNIHPVHSPFRRSQSLKEANVLGFYWNLYLRPYDIMIITSEDYGLVLSGLQLAPVHHQKLHWFFIHFLRVSVFPVLILKGQMFQILDSIRQNHS